MMTVISDGMRILVIYLSTVKLVYSSCISLDNCNGNGVCTLHSRCDSFEGWGAASDITTFRAPDCSARVCPSDISWGGVIARDGEAHNLAECSDKGICNRLTGKCKCHEGYEGAACQRLKCPNDCSGHGTCVTMERLASTTTGIPLSDFPTTYQSSNSSQAWDSLKIVGCVCESSWPVGLKVNETQAAEWFGPDCSLRHCPSADDPRTVADETDCSSSNHTASIGEKGNLCQVDCANQGICDYRTGTCQCFDGQYGTDCSLQMEIPVRYYFSPDGVYGPGPAAAEGQGQGAGQESADLFGGDSAVGSWAGTSEN